MLGLNIKRKEAIKEANTPIKHLALSFSSAAALVLMRWRIALN
jgi:hypothetical protein